MSGIQCLLVVARREDEREYQAFFQREKLFSSLSALGEGTASQSVLSYMGLEKTEKVILTAMTDVKRASVLMKKMISDMGINMPDRGIAISIPVGSIGGTGSMRLMLGRQDLILGEAQNMDDKRVFKYDLVVAISDRGSSNLVMSAARTAGAGGGTIIHAKGAGADSGKLFGIPIAPEKELLMIVVRHSDKDAIMRAVMEKAGANSEAHTAIFSLPVEDVVGLRSVIDEA